MPSTTRLSFLDLAKRRGLRTRFRRIIGPNLKVRNPFTGSDFQ